MVEASSTMRARLAGYGIAGATGLAVLAGAIYYVVHELFHILLGAGPVIDLIGSLALSGVAAAGVYLLGWNLRAVGAAFIAVFVTHTLVMGYGGIIALADFGWSMPMAVVGAVVFFLASGGLDT